MRSRAPMPVDWEREARHLALPPGVPGSGRLRYGAAMQFHAAGRMGDAALEVYRICSATDEDPGRLLALGGLPPPGAITPPTPQESR